MLEARLAMRPSSVVPRPNWSEKLKKRWHALCAPTCLRQVGSSLSRTDGVLKRVAKGGQSKERPLLTTPLLTTILTTPFRRFARGSEPPRRAAQGHWDLNGIPRIKHETAVSIRGSSPSFDRPLLATLLTAPSVGTSSLFTGADPASTHHVRPPNACPSESPHLGSTSVEVARHHKNDGPRERRQEARSTSIASILPCSSQCTQRRAG